jgi:hypothetical protein
MSLFVPGKLYRYLKPSVHLGDYAIFVLRVINYDPAWKSPVDHDIKTRTYCEFLDGNGNVCVYFLYDFSWAEVEE